MTALCEFRVWAPNLTNLAVRILGRTPSNRSHDALLTRNRRICGHVSQTSAKAPIISMFSMAETATSVPIRFRAGSRRAYTVLRASSIPIRFRWSDQGWAGIPLKDFIIYELHTGTFTPEGTFESVIPRLPYLRDLGITAIEIMPVAEFPGNRNWGYDGASLYPPQSSYGGPTGLKKLVDACHQHGLAVVMDVVYNHLGPEGNYLPEFAPCFTDAYHTPWGKAINFDGPESDGVRRWVIDNALVLAHRISRGRASPGRHPRHLRFRRSSPPRRIVRSISRIRRGGSSARPGSSPKAISKMCASSIPAPSAAMPSTRSGTTTFITLSMRCLPASGKAFLMDFGALADLAKSIREGFVFDWKYSRYRRRHYGSSSKDRPGEQFVGFIQNHDQIANTSRGKRLSSLVSSEQQKLAAVAHSVLAFPAVLFMGEEYGETAPFCSSPASRIQIWPTRARRTQKELGAHYSESDFADPQAPSTFERCKLDWSKTGSFSSCRRSCGFIAI